MPPTSAKAAIRASVTSAPAPGFAKMTIPNRIETAPLMILSGAVSILFGIVIFAKPGAGALVTLALIAAFALVGGITELVVAIGGKRLVESDLKRSLAPKPQPSSI